jgi:hypothetical protein
MTRIGALTNFHGHLRAAGSVVIEKTMMKMLGQMYIDKFDRARYCTYKHYSNRSSVREPLLSILAGDKSGHPRTENSDDLI